MAYEVDCPLTGARITVTTTNGDLDVDGYPVEVDGTDRGVILRMALCGPARSGKPDVTLTGLPPNCTIDGPASRRVTVVDDEAVPIEFAVVCTGSRTIRLDILNYVYPDMTPSSPSRLPWTGRCMTSRSPWAAVPSISVALDAACRVSRPNSAATPLASGFAVNGTRAGMGHRSAPSKLIPLRSSSSSCLPCTATFAETGPATSVGRRSAGFPLHHPVHYRPHPTPRHPAASRTLLPRGPGPHRGGQRPVNHRVGGSSPSSGVPAEQSFMHCGNRLLAPKLVAALLCRFAEFCPVWPCGITLG